MARVRPAALLALLAGWPCLVVALLAVDTFG